MVNYEGLPSPLEQKIVETHQVVESLMFLSERVEVVDAVKKYGQELIDGILYDILDEGAYYGLAKLSGEELAGHVPLAEARFGIQPGTHSVEIAFTPAYITPEGDLQSPKSFFMITNKFDDRAEESHVIELTDGGLTAETKPDVNYDFQRIEPLDMMPEDKERSDRSLAFLIEQAGVLKSEEVAIDDSPFDPENFDHAEIDVRNEMELSSLSVTEADLDALKELAEFAHKKLRSPE